MMNVNPMQLIGLLKGGMNPEQLVRSIIKENNINDPTINEMVSLA
jgi:methyl coenzyme M reductase beta subunit